MSSSDAPQPWVVFADDWGRHPSSCQHLVRHVLPHRPVVWVNTIGTRPPRLDWGTVKRAAGKLKGWFRPAVSRETQASEPNNPRVVSPKMWPSFRSVFARGLNRRLLLRSLSPVCQSLSPPPVVVTTLPLVADLVGRLPVARWVYYCVDDFSVWPGYDGETMLRMEQELVPKVDAVVAVSETLQAKLAAMGRESHLLTHGVDLDHWTTATVQPAPELSDLEPPIILFWGVIDRRMDTAFVRHLCEHLDRGTVVLVGPQEDPDPVLRTLPRLAVRPPVPFARLPALAQAAAVLVMPYADLPATRAMQPLKLKEYLATGKPAVVRDLPSTRDWVDAADVCDTPDAFTAAVRQRVVSGLPAEQGQARERLTVEGWATKAAAFEKWVCG
jgi:glycosyltransferase involved in cell wall biosynthesis